MQETRRLGYPPKISNCNKTTQRSNIKVPHYITVIDISSHKHSFSK